VLARAFEAYRQRLSDFGPTFAAEKLVEVEGVAIIVSVLRRRLIVAGDWKGGGYSPAAVERCTCFGVLVQFDGSLTVFWKEAKLFVKELGNTQDHKIQGAA